MDGLSCAAVIIAALCIVGFWLWQDRGDEQ